MKETIHKKKSLRAKLRQKLIDVDHDEISRRSIIACDRLCQTKQFIGANTIMIFLPLKYEVDARPVALHAWGENKTVAVPLVDHEQRSMLAVEIKSLTEPMDTDHFGLQTPANGNVVPIEMIDLVVVTGLGFDHTGHRLGRGGGFYDRFLAHDGFKGKSCGLAIDDQLVEKVPTLGHDIALNLLVTDKRMLLF